MSKFTGSSRAKRLLAGAALAVSGWGAVVHPDPQAGVSGERLAVKEVSLAVPDSPADPGGAGAAGQGPAGRLHGTLLLPPGGGPFPAVLLIAGSGPTDRDGNSPLLPGRNDSLKQLAEALARGGYASLRTDKRAIGRSVWPVLSEEALRFEDYVHDAAAWVRFLASDPRFPAVAVIGHSEGALVGLAAVQEAPASALVLVAAPGRAVQDTLRRQLSGQPEEVRRQVDAILARLERGERVAEVPPALAALFRPSVQPYLISLFRHDPQAQIRRVEVPVLIVQGERDLQVEPEDARLLREARPDARLVLIPEMNHVLKTVGESREANLQAYSDPAAPLSPALVEAITRFLAPVAR